MTVLLLTQLTQPRPLLFCLVRVQGAQTDFRHLADVGAELDVIQLSYTGII